MNRICHACHQTIVDDILNLPETVSVMGTTYRRDTWTTVRLPIPEGPTGLPAGDDLILYEIDWKPEQTGVITTAERVRAVTRASLFCEHIMRPSVLRLIARARWMPWPG